MLYLLAQFFEIAMVWLSANIRVVVLSGLSIIIIVLLLVNEQGRHVAITTKSNKHNTHNRNRRR